MKFYFETGFTYMGDILTVKDAAQRFGFSTKYIYAKIQAGDLKSLRKHGTTFIDSDDLLPSPYPTDEGKPIKQEQETHGDPINDTLQELKQQITELKQTRSAEDELNHSQENHQLNEYLQLLVDDQKQQIITLQQKPKEAPANQEMINYLQKVVKDQRRQISDLQERLDRSQKEVVNAIKDANARKDEQLKQYIEFLNNSTKELITTLEHKQPETNPEKKKDPVKVEDDVVDVDVEFSKDPVQMLLSDFLKVLFHLANKP